MFAKETLKAAALSLATLPSLVGCVSPEAAQASTRPLTQAEIWDDNVDKIDRSGISLSVSSPSQLIVIYGPLKEEESLKFPAAPRLLAFKKYREQELAENREPWLADPYMGGHLNKFRLPPEQVIFIFDNLTEGNYRLYSDWINGECKVRLARAD